MTSSSPSASPPSASSPGEVDLCGEVCPFTFVRTKLALEAVAMGETIRVIVDHEPAIRNIPRSAREWGQEVGSVGEHAPGRWYIDITRRAR